MTDNKRPDIERILARLAEGGYTGGEVTYADLRDLCAYALEQEAKVKGMEAVLMLKAASAPSWDALSPREHDALTRIVADIKAPLERINAALLPAAEEWLGDDSAPEMSDGQVKAAREAVKAEEGGGGE